MTATQTWRLAGIFVQIHGGRPIPFTPFHFGAGMLVKACCLRRFWLSSFVVANVLIDVEVLYHLRRGEPPIHRYLHTYAGGLAMGLVAGLLMFGVFQAARRFVPARSRSGEPVASTPGNRRLAESVIAGVFGGLSHVLLDSFMHHDMNPLWPFRNGNLLAGSIGVGMLHIWLAVAGLFGLILWLFLREW